LDAKRREIETRAAAGGDADVRWKAFEKASDQDFADELRAAMDKTEVVFRTAEAVRIAVAKHEVPRRVELYAAGPGYGRIDMLTGSIYWQVAVGGDEVILVSRREIADGCRALARSNDRILPLAIQERIRPLPAEAYGAKRVAVVLEDGTEYTGVHVAWNTEVVAVQGHGGIPFDVARIADLRHDPFP
jgi:hypothetical protein